MALFFSSISRAGWNPDRIVSWLMKRKKKIQKGNNQKKSCQTWIRLQSSCTPWEKRLLQLDVIERLAKFDMIAPETLHDVARVLENEIKTAQLSSKKIGGIKAISDMLNNIDRQASSTILSRIEENDPEMAEEIRQNMFIFEDRRQRNSGDFEGDQHRYSR